MKSSSKISNRSTQSRSLCFWAASAVIAFLVLVGLPIPSSATNATQTLTVTADNFLKKDSRNGNRGDYTLLKADEDNKSHILLRFDQQAIASALSGKTLISASLQVYIVQNWGGFTTSGKEVDVYRMTGDNGDWTEMGSTWNCPIDTNTSNSTADCAVQWDGGTKVSTATDHHQWYDTTVGWQSFNVTSDVNLFMSNTPNYGWLVRKLYSFETGSVDIASREYSQQNKAPKLVLTIADTPCTVTDITPSPAANQYGWYTTNVTVTFTCNDPDGVASCTSPQSTSTEGAQVCVTAQCVDSPGNTVTTTPCFPIDKTAPAVAITYPLNGATLDTCLPTVTGSVTEGLSGLLSLTCNGLDADVSGGGFSCQTPIASGSDTIMAEAADLAGNVGSTSISVTNTTSNAIITLDPGSPVVAAVDDEDVVGISGEGFDENDQLFLDDVPITTEWVNSNYLLVRTNFVSPPGVHTLSIKRPDSCPDTSSVLDPGILAIRDGEVLANPQTVAPEAGQAFSVYGYPNSFESGASVYLATHDSGCSQGLNLMQSVAYVNDQQLDVVTPALYSATYDLFVDNPEMPDFCQSSGLSVANPPMGPTGYFALWSCCNNANVLPDTSMETGQTASVTLKFKNSATTGGKTWKTSDGIDLSSYNKYWGVTNVKLPYDIAPQKWAIFSFNITAPKTAGTYTFQWSMRKEGVANGRFGSWAPCDHPTCQSGACGYDCRDHNSVIMEITVTESTPPADLGSCPDADPTDGESDTDAIQDCLDNQTTVELVPGLPGYILDDGNNTHDDGYALVVPETKTLRTKGTGGVKCWSWDGNINHDPEPDYEHCATLVALTPGPGQNEPVLHRRMIKLDGVGGQLISRIIVDGQGETRRNLSSLTDKCSGLSRLGNIYAFTKTKRNQGGKRWTVEKSVSMNDMCGSALRAQGVEYHLENNLIWDNGVSQKISGGGVQQDDPWSDGITAVHCDQGTIKLNTIIDSTDVGIASGGIGTEDNAQPCTITNNKIYQHNKHVFTGIAASLFDVGRGKWGNSTFTRNTIDGNNKMDFGMRAGKHPWDETVYVEGGTIGDTAVISNKGNTISRASINLNIDGWLNGRVGHNNLSSASTVDMQLHDYACCGSDSKGQNFTVGDTADNNGPDTLTSTQGTPDEYLTLHKINPSGSCPNDDCGNNNDNACSVCLQPDPDNCVCRNLDGTCACVDSDGRCKDCDTGQPIPYQPEAKEL